MTTPAPIDWTKFSNQQKLDFLVNAWTNGGPSTLYGASWQALIDDVPRRAGVAVKPATDAIAAQVTALQTGITSAVTAAVGPAVAAAVKANPQVVTVTIDQATITAIAEAVFQRLKAQVDKA